MKASVKSDYACRAVEALALHHPDTRPMRIEEIAQKEAIPSNYLVQILIELKSKGLIQSRRGKAGGYMLAKSPRGNHGRRRSTSDSGRHFGDAVVGGVALPGGNQAGVATHQGGRRRHGRR